MKVRRYAPISYAPIRCSDKVLRQKVRRSWPMPLFHTTHCRQTPNIGSIGERAF